jgi:hypothetical protein
VNEGLEEKFDHAMDHSTITADYRFVEWQLGFVAVGNYYVRSEGVPGGCHYFYHCRCNFELGAVCVVLSFVIGYRDRLVRSDAKLAANTVSILPDCICYGLVVL